jgi:hypothetical protein
MPEPAIARERSASSTTSELQGETTYLESSRRTLLGSESCRGRASESRRRSRHLQLEPPERARSFASLPRLKQQRFHPFSHERTRVGGSANPGSSGVRAAESEVLEVGVVRVQGDEEGLREDGGRGADRQGAEGGQVREGKAEFALQFDDFLVNYGCWLERQRGPVERRTLV